MAYRKKSFIQPELKHDPDSGQACIYWGKKRYRLGAWNGQGTPPTDVLQNYLRTVAFLEDQFAAQVAGVPEPEDASRILIDEGVSLYLHHLRVDEDGDLRPDGTLSTHYERAVTHLRPLSALFGNTWAGEFNVQKLKLVRQAVRKPKPDWWKAIPGYLDPLPSGQKRREPKQWGVFYSNNAMQNIIGFFAWLESEGFVPEGKTEHLKTIKPLKGELPYEAQTVADEDVEIVCRYTSPQVAAMIRLQRITAMRPGELVRMRPCDIDASGDVWIYTPRDPVTGRQAHKTARRGHSRQIPLCTRCQAIMEPFLTGRGERDYLFQPREAAAWWKEKHAQEVPKEPRKTTLYPSELKAREKRKRQRARRKDKKRQPGERYTQYSYRQAIEYAIQKAKAADEDVKEWTPYALRHTRITEVQREYGWEDAQAVAGHESQNVTKRYAHERHQRALRLAAEAQTKRDKDKSQNSSPAEQGAAENKNTTRRRRKH